MEWTSFFVGILAGWAGLIVAGIAVWRYSKTWIMSKIASFALNRAVSGMVRPQNNDTSLLASRDTQ